MYKDIDKIVVGQRAGLGDRSFPRRHFYLTVFIPLSYVPPSIVAVDSLADDEHEDCLPAMQAAVNLQTEEIIADFVVSMTIGIRRYH